MKVRDPLRRRGRAALTSLPEVRAVRVFGAKTISALTRIRKPPETLRDRLRDRGIVDSGWWFVGAALAKLRF